MRPKAEKKAGVAKKKGWAMVRQQSGIRFDSWDMALQVVENQWRGELAREVQARVAAHFPENPWGKVILGFLAYWAGFFCLRADMGPPEDPTLSKGFALVLIWTCSTLGGKLMGPLVSWCLQDWI